MAKATDPSGKFSLSDEFQSQLAESVAKLLVKKAPEKPGELQARLDREKEDAAHGRWRESGTLIFAAAVLGLSFLIAVAMIAWPGDLRQTGMTILGWIVPAAIGFIGGRGSTKLNG